VRISLPKAVTAYVPHGTEWAEIRS
jgi:hypothetical protein